MNIEKLIQDNFSVGIHPKTKFEFPVIIKANKMIPKQCSSDETFEETVLLWIAKEPMVASKLTKNNEFIDENVINIIENKIIELGFVKKFYDNDYFEFCRV